MIELAAIRADSVNLPLFLHVLGAMALVGALVLVALSLAGSWRNDDPGSLRTGYRALLLLAIPSWIVMRAAAQWVADEEGYTGDEVPSWIDIGFMTAEPTLLLLIVATVLAGLSSRRAARADAGGSATMTRVSVVLVSIALLASVVAIWAMTTKPT